MLLHKKSRTFKKIKHIITKCPSCWGNAFAMSFTFLAHGTQCVPNFKCHCGALYFPLHIALNVLDHNKLMANKRAWKKVALQTRDAAHPPQRHR
jgi:hypothetical protein